MSSLLPSAHGSGLQFRILGFPVTISASIAVLLAFFGFGDGGLVAIVTWVVIGILSILLHELGHAVAARAAGASPEIRLAGLGGVTVYRQNERTRGRGWSLLISVAGPAVGIVLGIVALAAGASVRVPRGAPLADYAMSVFVFTSLGWGILNLLPMLPLDGGQAMAQLLPGSPVDRRRLAARVSIGVGIAALGLALVYDQPFAAILVGLMTYQNWQSLTADRAHRALRELVDEGRIADARRRLDAGEGDPELLARLQEAAMTAGHHQTAAEVGEIALSRGWEHEVYAVRSAQSWARLGADDRALDLLVRARGLGLDPARVADVPEFQSLRTHPGWGRVTGEVDPPPPPPPARS